jgi:hypothetical protein
LETFSPYRQQGSKIDYSSNVREVSDFIARNQELEEKRKRIDEGIIFFFEI